MDQDVTLRRLMDERFNLQAYIRGIVSDTHLAEDILQEVFIVAIRQRDEYTTGTNFGAWVREIARRTAYAQIRKAGRQPPALDPAILDALENSFQTPTDVWEHERDALAECMRELPPESQQILRLKYSAELPVAEISRNIGRSEDGVKSLLKRLRQMLAECVNARLRRAGLQTGGGA